MVRTITGSLICGYISEKQGRRYRIILFSIVGIGVMYPYTTTSSKAIIAPAFFEQFCVIGTFAIPIHLMELLRGA